MQSACGSNKSALPPQAPPCWRGHFPGKGFHAADGYSHRPQEAEAGEMENRVFRIKIKISRNGGMELLKEKGA